MPTQVTLPYGSGHVDVSVPTREPPHILIPRDVAPAPDPVAVLRRALRRPLGVPSLAEMARRARDVVILIDDLTRLTPVADILPLLLEDLEAGGVSPDQITVIVALGTHRAMTEAELRARVGEDVWGRVAVLNHEHWNSEALIDLGLTPNGTPIVLNRRVWEADLVIGVGSVYPHHIAGYSGGSKIVQPGVSGARTTGATHILSTRTRRSYLGWVDNVVRREMDRVAAAAGLKAVFNCVLTRTGRVVDAFFGAPRAVLAAAARAADAIYGVPFSHPADVVIAGSYPADIEFWQAHKSLYPADMVVRDRGTIIVVTPCPEGVAVTHPALLELAGMPRDALLLRIDRGDVDDWVAAGLALAWAQVRERAQVSLVSDGIPPEHARALGFVPFPSAQDALEEALRRHGPDARVAVLPFAPETLPLREDTRGR